MSNSTTSSPDYSAYKSAIRQAAIFALAMGDTRAEVSEIFHRELNKRLSTDLATDLAADPSLAQAVAVAATVELMAVLQHFPVWAE